MAKVIIRGQMVSIHKIEEKAYKDPAKANEKLKIIYFTVADRERVSVNNGSTYETAGFYFCKAVGHDAKFIEEHCTKKNAEGKLISRKVYLEGEIRQYKASKLQKVQMPVPIKDLFDALKITCPESFVGQKISLEKTEEIKYDNYVFEIDKVRLDDFLDSQEASAPAEIKISLDSPPSVSVASKASYEAPAASAVSAPIQQTAPAYVPPTLPDVFQEDIENPFL